MSAPIIRHNELEGVADDIEHSIPALGVIDVHVVKIGGGADLSLVIATPMQADERSQQRLLAKLEGYLSFINSEEFQSQAGPANLANTRVLVQVHAESDRTIFELLERCKPWVAENGAALEVCLLEQCIN